MPFEVASHERRCRAHPGLAPMLSAAVILHCWGSAHVAAVDTALGRGGGSSVVKTCVETCASGALIEELDASMRQHGYGA